MPKRKASPKKLSDLQRKENYCFGGVLGAGAGTSNNDVPEAAATSNHGVQSSSSKKKPKKPVCVRVEHVDGLDELLEDSEYYVTIKRKPELDGNEVGGRYCLGHLNLKLHDHYMQQNESLPPHEFWLYVSRIPGRSMIYFEWLEEDGAYKRVKYFTVETALEPALYNGMQEIV